VTAEYIDANTEAAKAEIGDETFVANHSAALAENMAIGTRTDV